MTQASTLSLAGKYNVPAPRYTSYPTVPYWQEEPPTGHQWQRNVLETFERNQQISLYIHLPFCERLCTYCGCNTRITKNHGVEAPYLEALAAEWRQYLDLLPGKPRLKELHLGGGTPTFFQPGRLQTFLESLLAQTTVEEDAIMSFEAHPNSTSTEHLQALYEVGFRRISVGVQDFDEEILGLINRRQTTAQVYQVTEEARRIGYTSVNYDIIFGLPRQTSDHIRRTTDHLRGLRPERIAFYSYAHVPWMKPGQRAYSEADLPTEAAKRALYEDGKARLEAMGYLEIGMDHFALPGDELEMALRQGRLHRNFMGYTPFATELLIGLGASAISDAFSAFVQNEKKVEDYSAAVLRGRHPIIRGHLLSEEDQFLRRQITNIMCKLETHWGRAHAGRPEIQAARERLREPLADGLVRLFEDGLEVTPAGRPFVRNIGMAFDARLWARQPSGRLFSQAV
jgi:oxygen-independent coproporphyrinogen-3 oxidase